MDLHDPFGFFRFILGWLVTIYATLITVQSLWGWYVWFAGQDRYIGLLRRYVIIHGLRLRFRSFMGDALISILLCVVFIMLWKAHYIMYDLRKTISSLPHEQHTASK